MDNRNILFEKGCKLNLKIIYASCILLVVNYAMNYGMDSIFTTAVIPSLLLISVAELISRFVKNDFIKAIMMPVLVSTCFLIFTYLAGGASNVTVVMLSTVVMSAVYFNKKILITYSIYVNVALVLIQTQINALGEDKGASILTAHMVALGVAIVMLYFLVVWVSDLLDQSIANEKKATELVEKMEMTFRTIDSSGQILDKSIEGLSYSSEIVKNECSNISVSLSEINVDIASGSETLEKISDNTKNVNREVEKTYELSNKLEKLSNMLKKSTDSNSRNIFTMKEQINIVNQNNNNINNCVNDFKKEMESLSEITELIREVARQTNLVALNAEIEAVRAGEQGKSFSIVAGEVRDLSLEVTNITNVIDEKIMNGFNTLTEMEQQALEGIKASTLGNSIVVDTSKSFEEMSEIINNINKNIYSEYELVENVKVLVNEIYSSVQDTSKFINVCTSITEEIVGMQEEQEAMLGTMLNDIDNVKSQNIKLKELLH